MNPSSLMTMTVPWQINVKPINQAKENRSRFMLEWLPISHFCSSYKNVSLLSWKPGQLGKSRMLRMTVKYTTTVLLHYWNPKRSLKCLKRLHFKNGTGGGTNRTMDRPTDRREESLASDFSVLPIYQPKLVIRIFHHRKCLFIAKRNFITQRSKTC